MDGLGACFGPSPGPDPELIELVKFELRPFFVYVNLACRV
jgi:hypothetical protein